MFAWRTYPSAGQASPGAYLTVPALARRGIAVAFTTRHGGASVEPYAALNLSYSSGDDAAIVARNRTQVLSALGGSLESWTGARQVHGNHAVRVGISERGAGWDSPHRVVPDADALWTDEEDVSVVVLTADCMPILLADPARRRVAAVHAGWRGLLAGVVERCIDSMGGPGGLRAFIGPSIGPCCYEVGDDVAGPAGETFGAGVLRVAEGRQHLDLWGGSIRALNRAGVREVWPAALCTRCESGRFYSHRAGARGRQGLVARIVPS